MGGAPPQSPQATMTVQLGMVINAASELALRQALSLAGCSANILARQRGQSPDLSRASYSTPKYLSV